jgi:acyl carrier protein
VIAPSVIALSPEGMNRMNQTASASSGSSFEEVVQQICSELEKVNTHGVSLNESTDITSDLNLDSVAIMDLLFELEERYDVSIPVNRLGEVRTVGQLAEEVRTIIAGR